MANNNVEKIKTPDSKEPGKPEKPELKVEQKPESFKEVVEKQGEEVKGQIEKLKQKGNAREEILEKGGANKEEITEFKAGEKKIEGKADKAKEDYENSFRTPGDIESESRELKKWGEKRQKLINLVKDSNPYLFNRMEQMKKTITKHEAPGGDSTFVKTAGKELSKLENQLEGSIDLIELVGGKNPEKTIKAMKKLEEKDPFLFRKVEVIKRTIKEKKQNGKDTTEFEKKLDEAKKMLIKEMRKEVKKID